MGFNFNYYGETFSSITVCSNGWTSFLPCLDGNTTDGVPCDPLSYFYNTSINFPIGPYGMIAPFFYDLDDNNGTEPLYVYAAWDPQESEFIVQWDNIANSQVD